MVTSSSLLLVYLAFLVLRYTYSRSKLVQGWTRRLIGKPPKEEKMLLHTLPYYLAITRSSCEVICLFCLIICFSERKQKTQLVTYFTNGSVFPIIAFPFPLYIAIISFRLGRIVTRIFLVVSF